MRATKTIWQQQGTEEGLNAQRHSGTNQGNCSGGKARARQETKLMTEASKKQKKKQEARMNTQILIK